MGPKSMHKNDEKGLHEEKKGLPLGRPVLLYPICSLAGLHVFRKNSADIPQQLYKHQAASFSLCFLI
jgi:hypothetical protein